MEIKENGGPNTLRLSLWVHICFRTPSIYRYMYVYIYTEWTTKK